MLLTNKFELWAKSISGPAINFTRYIISCKTSEGLDASRLQLVVVLQPEAKTQIQNVKKGGEWQLVWGFSPQVYRQISAFWTAVEWNLGGSNTIQLTFVNLGQYKLARGNTTRAISQSASSLAELALSRGVKLTGAKLTNPQYRVLSQAPLKEILRDQRESFMRWSFDAEATAEIVLFSELGSKAQIHYIDTKLGFIGEIKITYAAQLPKDTSFIEVSGKGLTLQTDSAVPAPSAIVPSLPQLLPDAKNDNSILASKLWSFCITDRESGAVLKSRNAALTAPEGTSMAKLFIALVVEKQISQSLYSISSVWQGKTIAQLLQLTLDQSLNESANSLIARIGGIRVLNQELKSFGFFNTSFKSLYGVQTTGVLPLENLNWERYALAAKANGYIERYQQAQGLLPIVTAALQKMRTASGMQLKLVSGFRSFNEQEKIWLSKPENSRANFSAPPGYSQHHTGLALDLVTVEVPSASEQTELTWLKNNAIKFGFIIPYTTSAVDLGPEPEPWHLLYVGTAPAMAVFHDFIARSKALGYDPLAQSPELQKVFNSPESLPAGKQTNCFDLCKAMALILKSTTPTSAILKNALRGSYIGFEGEEYAKLGYTSKVIGATVVTSDKIISAYLLGSSEQDLKVSMKLLGG
jgi:D-alanyl-D-alanine carboxypeptidase